MGQYYYIVNIDKHEYLHPHKFNDGLKLLEAGVLFGDFKDVSGDALLAMTDDPYVRHVLEKERNRILKPDIVLSAV